MRFEGILGFGVRCLCRMGSTGSKAPSSRNHLGVTDFNQISARVNTISTDLCQSDTVTIALNALVGSRLRGHSEWEMVV